MKLAAAYPEFIEQSTRSPNGFTPHLTIAKFTIGGDNNKENVAKLITEWKSAFKTDPLEFEIDRIHLICRKANNAFRIKKTVPIGPNVKELRNSSYLEKFLSVNNLLLSDERANV